MLKGKARWRVPAAAAAIVAFVAIVFGLLTTPATHTAAAEPLTRQTSGSTPTIVLASASSSPGDAATASPSTVLSFSPSAEDDMDTHYVSCSLYTANDIAQDFRGDDPTSITGSAPVAGSPNDMCYYAIAPSTTGDSVNLMVAYVCNTVTTKGGTVAEAWNQFTQQSTDDLSDSAPGARYYQDNGSEPPSFEVGVQVNGCFVQIGAPTTLSLFNMSDSDILGALRHALLTAYNRALATKPTPVQ